MKKTLAILMLVFLSVLISHCSKDKVTKVEPPKLGFTIEGYVSYQGEPLEKAIIRHWLPYRYGESTEQVLSASNGYYKITRDHYWTERYEAEYFKLRCFDWIPEDDTFLNEYHSGTIYEGTYYHDFEF